MPVMDTYGDVILIEGRHEIFKHPRWRMIEPEDNLLYAPIPHLIVLNVGGCPLHGPDSQLFEENASRKTTKRSFCNVPPRRTL